MKMTCPVIKKYLKVTHENNRMKESKEGEVRIERKKTKP
jgi:hypothetical protein